MATGSAFSRGENLYPVLGEKKWPQPFIQKVLPLDHMQDDESES